MGAYGLQSHIWNNNLKSVALLAGFPVLLILVLHVLLLAGVALTSGTDDLALAQARAFDLSLVYWPLALIAAGAWFLIAFAGRTLVKGMC